MAMEGSLFVSPEKLISTSGEFSSIMSQVTSLTSNMIDLIHSLSNLWQGDASSSYKNRFDQLDDDIKRMAAMINEHVNDLQEMAQAYQNAEIKNQDLSNSLAGDIIL
jgi:WXG100 family type VII secretion target